MLLTIHATQQEAEGLSPVSPARHRGKRAHEKNALPRGELMPQGRVGVGAPQTAQTYHLRQSRRAT